MAAQFQSENERQNTEKSDEEMLQRSIEHRRSLEAQMTGSAEKTGARETVGLEGMMRWEDMAELEEWKPSRTMASIEGPACVRTDAT